MITKTLFTKTIVSRAAAAALSLAAPVLGRAAEPQSPASDGPRVVAVEHDAARGTRRVAGTIAAAQRATIATRIAATVTEVRVREGDRVRAGDVLVRLSDDDVRGALAASEAALATASAHEKRIRNLIAQQAATAVELDQAVAQRAQAQASVAAARATVGYAALRAPFAGTVQAKRVDVGDLVGPGQPLVDVEGTAGLEIQATVSESEAATLRVGTRLPFTAGSRRGAATVSALAPGGDPLSHRVSLRARIVEGGDGLRSGTFARLEVPAAADAPAAALWIPRTALVERGDLTGVFVADAGRARLRWLALGETDADRVAVQAGLRPGETVVDRPGALRDGAPLPTPASSER